MEKVTLIKLKRGREYSAGWIQTRYPTANELKEFFSTLGRSWTLSSGGIHT